MEGWLVTSPSSDSCVQSRAYCCQAWLPRVLEVSRFPALQQQSFEAKWIAVGIRIRHGLLVCQSDDRPVQLWKLALLLKLVAFFVSQHLLSPCSWVWRKSGRCDVVCPCYHSSTIGYSTQASVQRSENQGFVRFQESGLSNIAFEPLPLAQCSRLLYTTYRIIIYLSWCFTKPKGSENNLFIVSTRHFPTLPYVVSKHIHELSLSHSIPLHSIPFSNPRTFTCLGCALCFCLIIFLVVSPMAFAFWREGFKPGSRISIGLTTPSSNALTLTYLAAPNTAQIRDYSVQIYMYIQHLAVMPWRAWTAGSMRDRMDEIEIRGRARRRDQVGMKRWMRILVCIVQHTCTQTVGLDVRRHVNSFIGILRE